MVDQVDAHPAVAAGGDGDLDLGAHPVGTGHQHGVAKTSLGEGEQPAEGADVAQHRRGVGGGDGALDQGDGAVALVDVDAGVGVAEVAHVEPRLG